MKKSFTTGQIAKACNVASRTVCQWVDKGKLRGYRLPTGGDRRVLRNDLAAFLKTNGMPLDLIADCFYRVLVIGPDAALSGKICDLLPESGGFVFRQASTVFEAGLQVSEHNPDCVVVDMAIGRGETLRLGDSVLAFAPQAKLVAILGEDYAEAGELGRFAATFRKPFDLGELRAFLVACEQEKGKP